jgi:integrase
MTRSQAEVQLAAILRPINEGTAPVARPVLTFGQFVEGEYFTHCRRTWKRSTETTTVSAITTHLLPVFRDRFLGTITRGEMQDLLEAKALERGRSIVSHLRWHLNGIYKLALSDGLVDHNPAQTLRVPKDCKAGRTTRPLTEAEVPVYLGVLDLRERLMARLAIFEGLRPGEILALLWGTLENDAVQIRQRVYQGNLDTPKSGKARLAALSDGTQAEIRKWRKLARSTAPDAFVFPSENPASPLDRKNIWERSFAPPLETVGLEWATFQVLRKTNASLSKKAGVDAKVSADQRGHGLGVSMEVYTISDRQQKREAVKSLELLVTPKPKRKLSA